MVGEVGFMYTNTGSADVVLQTQRHSARNSVNPSEFTRGSPQGQARGWTRPPAATTLQMGPEGQVAPMHQVGDVTLTMNSHSPMQALLHDYFSPYMNDATRVAFGEIVDSRAAGLEEMGHDAQRVQENMRKANNFDWAATATVGAVNAMPFAVSSVALDTIPAMLALAGGNPAAQGAMGGAIAGAADVAGVNLLANATKDHRWLNAAAARMEPVMQEAITARTPGALRRAAEIAAALQTYTMRNAGRALVAPVAQALGGTAARVAVDSAISAGGGVVAGAGFGMASRYFDQRRGMDGPALLFGQRDWLNLYKQLDAATWARQAGNAMARVGAFPGDVATGTLGAVRSLATPAGLAEIAVLAGGFSAINPAVQAVVQGATDAGLNQPATQFLAQATNFGLSPPLFTALPFAMLGANHVAQAGTRSIQHSGWSNAPAGPEALAQTPAPQPQHTVLDLGDDEAHALLAAGSSLPARGMQTSDV